MVTPESSMLADKAEVNIYRRIH